MGPRAFDFVPLLSTGSKPRRRGLTEIRGPYYTPMGPSYLEDVLRTMGAYVDSLKFAGGSFTLMPRDVLVEIIELCHRHDVRVSTGGFLERILARDPSLVDRYLLECRAVGFDVVELSAGFVTLPFDDWLRLVERVRGAGLEPKPEVGIQFGAGGATDESTLARLGTRDVRIAIEQVRRFLDAGVPRVMIESEGITENVARMRTDVIAEIVSAVGLERVMFEAADPEVFRFYVRTYGPDVNLFVDHSQIVELAALRTGTWGTHDLWGRIVRFENG